MTTLKNANCFGWGVCRDFQDDEIPVVIEIVDVDLPDPSVGYGGNIEIEAYYEDGKSCQLTPLEHDRAIELACDHMEQGKKDFEESQHE